jgi:hypothetical protein
LSSWLELKRNALLVRVNTRGARYPVRIDPLIQQGSKLTGSGEAGSGSFGQSVALSSDGQTALIGGGEDNLGTGAAWVFTRFGSTWTQQAPKLTAGGGEEIGKARFGSSLALSADGNTALIGAAGDNGNAGAGWIFTRSGSTWTQQGPKLAGSGEVAGCCGGDLGYSVALSADGNTALVGGYNDSNATGAVWVFTRSGSTWTQQGEKLTAKSGEEISEGGFGSAVALSGEGDTALIGGAAHGFPGAAWIFTRSGSTWTQQGERLTAASKEPSEDFGRTVALSADGSTALIGGLNGTPGAAWVFARSGSAWTQQGAQLTLEHEEVGTGADFGASVALSSDGNTALIGGPHEGRVVEIEKKRVFEDRVGGAWIFRRSGSSWPKPPEKLLATEAVAEDEFGGSVALSSDGATAVIGGPSDNGGMGASWLFSNPPTVVSVPTPAPISQTKNPPILANVAESNRTWREGKRLASFARTRKLPPIGTTFSFTLNEQASVTFAFTQQATGRKVKGKCVAQTRANRRKRVCQRSVAAGTLSFPGHTGSNRLTFQGRIARSQTLRPGAYTLVVTATDAGGRSQPARLTFTIVR